MRPWMPLMFVAAVLGGCNRDADAQVSYAPTDASGFITQDQLNQAAAANLNIMAATTPQFVGGSSAYMTLAQLFATYPASPATLGYLAHVSDAWGNVATTLVCEGNGTSYYWRPQRTDYSTTVPIASGTVTLTPLQTAPIVYLPTTPTGNVTVSLSTANVWPGATFRIYAPSGLGTGNINISGLVGGGTVPLVQGSDKTITYISGVGWKSN